MQTGNDDPVAVDESQVWQSAYIVIDSILCVSHIDDEAGTVIMMKGIKWCKVNQEEGGVDQCVDAGGKCVSQETIRAASGVRETALSVLLDAKEALLASCCALIACSVLLQAHQHTVSSPVQLPPPSAQS